MVSYRFTQFEGTFVHESNKSTKLGHTAWIRQCEEEFKILLVNT